MLSRRELMRRIGAALGVAMCTPATPKPTVVAAAQGPERVEVFGPDGRLLCICLPVPGGFLQSGPAMAGGFVSLAVAVLGDGSRLPIATERPISLSEGDTLTINLVVD